MKKFVSLLLILVLALSLGVSALADPVGWGASEQWQSQTGLYDVVVRDNDTAYNGFIHFTAPQTGSYTISSHSTDPENDYPRLRVLPSDKYETFSLASDGNYPRDCSVTVDLTKDNTYLIDVSSSNSVKETVIIPVEIVYNGGTGSVLSEGSLAIVTAVVGLAVGLVGGYFLFGRKKKTAEA